MILLLQVQSRYLQVDLHLEIRTVHSEGREKITEGEEKGRERRKGGEGEVE